MAKQFWEHILSKSNDKDGPYINIILKNNNNPDHFPTTKF